MFRNTLIGIVITAALLSAEKSDVKEKSVRLGLGGSVGTEDYRGGLRFWIKERIGATINAGTNWDRDMEVGEAQLHVKLLKNKRFSPYLGAGIGLSRVNILDRIPPAFNEKLWGMSGHIGGELFLGRGGRHGLSLQVDYTNGKLEYKKRSSTVIGDGSQQSTNGEITLTPFSGKLLYHFYFIPIGERDKDGDGIRGDKCPDVAEDIDGFKDDDGCPDFDNDGDGIKDDDDMCPLVAEDVDQFEDGDGCPEDDNDGDGIEDITDNCPMQPEDKDGFEDSDGCPDEDNDGDGIPDSEDQCPNEKETENGFHDDDGCFDSVMPEVIEQEIAQLPNEAIQFEINSFELLESSFPVLDSLLSILQKWPDQKVSIEGHTDNSGASYTNQLTSEKRAKAVVEYLIGKGIDKSRLKAVGYGETKPKFDNRTREGRIKNRRVEIVKE